MSLSIAGKVPIDVNLAPIYAAAGAGHGKRTKTLIVLHETVSHERPGVSDIVGNAKYMASLTPALAAHGILDGEGNVGWAYGMRTQYFYHAKGANEHSIGLEQVSPVPSSKAERIQWWKDNTKLLDTTAAVCAAISKLDHIPLKYDPTAKIGICSHWDVSRAAGLSGGHWDCWPKHRGGHYPIYYVIYKAKQYYSDWFGP